MAPVGETDPCPTVFVDGASSSHAAAIVNETSANPIPRRFLKLLPYLHAPVVVEDHHWAACAPRAVQGGEWRVSG